MEDREGAVESGAVASAYLTETRAMKKKEQLHGAFCKISTDYFVMGSRLNCGHIFLR